MGWGVRYAVRLATRAIFGCIKKGHFLSFKFEPISLELKAQRVFGGHLGFAGNVEVSQFDGTAELAQKPRHYGQFGSRPLVDGLVTQ